jgi:hypothetical protein
MNRKIDSYRQPLVTATGILLGFALSVAGAWAPRAFGTLRFSEVVLGIGLFIYIPLYILVLFRILRMNYPEDKQEAYYKKTLYIFLTANTVFYLSIVIIMVESFIINR